MMGTRSLIFLAACAVFYNVCVVPSGSGGWLGVEGLFVVSEDAKLTDLSGTEEEMMEQIWPNCLLDIFAMVSVTKAPDLQMLHIENMLESLTHLTPEMKHSLIDCLIKQSLHASQDTIPKNMYATHLSRILRQDLNLRQRLTGQLVHKISLASPLSSPARRPQSTSPAPGSTPTMRAKSPAPIPSLSPSEPPLPEDDPEDLSPSFLPDDLFDPDVVRHPIPHLPVVPPTEHRSNNLQVIIIAVLVTAAATFILAMFCFCCCNRYVGRKYQTVNGQRDERPILSLSHSDFSGSSQISFGLVKDKSESSSFKADPNQNDQNMPFVTLAEEHLTEPTKASHNPPPAAPPPPPLKSPPGKNFAPPPAPPPPLPKVKPAPPLPKVGPPPPKGGPLPPKGSSSSIISHHTRNKSVNVNADSDIGKTKLKPLFWDKVMANPDQSMVWHQLKAGSFQFNEEMIETLFGYNASNTGRNDARKDFGNYSSQCIQILDPKKSQNLAISLKAQNVKVEEICDALMEGNELPIELLQTLMRMAPTTDEELKLRLFNDDSVFLGPAEQFLKAIVNIPFAFKRMDALLFMTSLQEESSSLKESFATLEKASKDLKDSRLFLKLLEAVLKTGNRMNDGTYRGGAYAFKLDTLLKLSDIKGTDGKTTLLHFVTQEIIRSEGKRAVRVAMESRNNSGVTCSSYNSDDLTDDVFEESEDHHRSLGLRVVLSLSNELKYVKRAAGLDADTLSISVASLGNRLVKAKEFLNTEMRNLEERSGFHETLEAFVGHAEADVTHLLEEEKRVRSLVKHTTDYFHGNTGRDEGLRLFVIVRDFLEMLDKVCKEIRTKKATSSSRNNESAMQVLSESRQVLFPAGKIRCFEGSSSEDEDF